MGQDTTVELDFSLDELSNKLNSAIELFEQTLTVASNPQADKLRAFRSQVSQSIKMSRDSLVLTSAMIDEYANGMENLVQNNMGLISDLNDQMEVYREKIDEVAATADRKVELLESDNSDLQNTVKELQSELDEKTNNLNKLLEQKTVLEQECAGFKEKLASNKKKKMNLEGQIEDAFVKLQFLEDKRKSVEKERCVAESGVTEAMDSLLKMYEKE